MDAAKKDALDANPAVLMDGRTRRILESLKGQVETLQNDLNDLTFLEDLDTGGDKKRKSALQEVFKIKRRKFSKIAGDANAALKRIKESTSKNALEEVSVALNSLVKKASAGSKFVELVSKANPPPEVLHLSFTAVIILMSGVQWSLTSLCISGLWPCCVLIV